jgi:phenylacetate-coenzyme A ligase PaaK-like adenylate-forming protein
MTFDRLFFKHAIYMPTVWARGEALQKYLEEFAASQWAPPASLRALQEQKLNRLVDWACAKVPFYRERIDRSRWPRHLSLDDVAALPMLSKADLRDRGRELVVKTTELPDAASQGRRSLLEGRLRSLTLP